jgi:hypothetical protein
VPEFVADVNFNPVKKLGREEEMGECPEKV